MTPLRVGITTSSFADSDPAPREMLHSAGIEVVENPYGRRLTEAEAIDYLADKDGLIAGLEPLNRKVLESAPLLKAIARVGIGIANVDLEAAREKGIKVSNTPDGPTQAVAEMTVTAALALSRGLVATNAKLHAGEWAKSIGQGLIGRTVLFVGYGRIGRKTAEMMRVFGPQILVADPFLKPEDLIAGEKLVDLEEGLTVADIISLHASGEEVILGSSQFSKVKKGVILLNSARGSLVDEQALITALEDGIVGAAWFDAFWKEPYEGPLTKYDNVLLTPHVGTYTAQCRSSMELAAVQNLLRDLGVSF
ncbi:MAG: phosphoglycerate dehydrogenase [bacterium]